MKHWRRQSRDAETFLSYSLFLILPWGGRLDCIPRVHGLAGQPQWSVGSLPPFSPQRWVGILSYYSSQQAIHPPSVCGLWLKHEAAVAISIQKPACIRHFSSCQQFSIQKCCINITYKESVSEDPALVLTRPGCPGLGGLSRSRIDLAF